ncbi:MAG: MlaD family protein [Solirubrobacteraceae bacterium]
MRPGKRGLSFFTVGLIAIVVVVAGTFLGFNKGLPFQHHFTVKAIFRNSNNVKKASPVRIAGVNIGKVSKVEPMPGGVDRSIVSMAIEDKGLPIHSDATVAVRPRIFLEGNFFVDLKPGTPSSKTVKDGDTLPEQQATSPVQLDQILSSLQKDTRHNLQTLLLEYGRGVQEGGDGYNRSIKYWEPAYKNSAIVNEATLGQNAHDLSGYIKESGVVAEALDKHPGQLKSLITDFNTTAGAFASQSNALSSAIDELPRTLKVGQPALAALNNALPPVRALSNALRPGVRSTGPTIDVSLPFIAQARQLVSEPELRGLVRDLRPTVPSLALLQIRSVPLYQQVRLASSCQNDVILPWTRDTVPDNARGQNGLPDLRAKGPVYYESTKSLPGLAGESRAGDANGIYFRVLAGGGTNQIGFKTDQAAGPANTLLGPAVGTSFAAIQGLEPLKPQVKGGKAVNFGGTTVRPPIRPHVPCETQTPPKLDTPMAGAPKSLAAAAPTKKSSDALKKAFKEMLKERTPAGQKPAGDKKSAAVPNIPQIGSVTGR